MQTTVVPYIPPRFLRLDTDEPRAHCSVKQVMGKLLGINLDQFRDPDGTLTSFTTMIAEDLIPEVSTLVTQEFRTPYDWCRRAYFQDGSSGNSIVLPNRAIAAVNVVFIRILPSLPWYRFSRFRAIDGTEFNRAGFAEPPNTEPFIAPYRLGDSGTVVSYTGIEDADILVDTNGRTIIIPPRALILAANAAVPFANYSFIPGTCNVEIHYTFGYAPTRYESGALLTFDPLTGVVQDPNPSAPFGTVDPIEWSSGMPRGLTNAVSRLAANRLLRQNWRGISFGLSSLNVDGGSESYGSKPYSGDLDADEEAILQGVLSTYAITSVF